jgi:uncharacterized protein (TIGR03435 family)
MTLRVFRTRFFAALLAAGIAVSVAAAQDAAIPSFEVASIRSSGKTRESPNMGATTAGINYTNVTLRSCIATAYEVQEYRVSGPAWLDSEHYDITAKTDGRATTPQLRQMLQSLLTERFKVSLHRDKKDLPVLALVVGKSGFKAPLAEGDGPHSFGPNGVGPKFDLKSGSMILQRTSLEDFAAYLSKFAGIGRPVVDRTELKGVYNINLQMVENPAGMSPAEMKTSLRDGMDGTGVLTAVQTLGLKLDPQHAPVEVLVLDHAEKVPTDN